MAITGLRTLYTALKDASGSTLTGKDGLSENGIFEIDAVRGNGNLGSKSANISNMSGNIAKVSGNNQVVDVEVGEAAPTVTIDSNAINHTALQKLLGKEQSASGAWIPKDGVTEGALIIETQDRVSSKRVWYAFGRGIFSQSTQNVGSNTDTAKTSEDDNITFTAEGYKLWNNKAYATYYEDDFKDGDVDANIKKMFDEVCPGNSYDPKTGGTTKADTGGTPGTSGGVGK